MSDYASRYFSARCISDLATVDSRLPILRRLLFRASITIPSIGISRVLVADPPTYHSMNTWSQHASHWRNCAQ
jgi:hypothetical protein